MKGREGGGEERRGLCLCHHQNEPSGRNFEHHWNKPSGKNLEHHWDKPSGKNLEHHWDKPSGKVLNITGTNQVVRRLVYSEEGNDPCL